MQFAGMSWRRKSIKKAIADDLSSHSPSQVLTQSEPVGKCQGKRNESIDIARNSVTVSGTEIIPSTLQAEQPWFDYPVRVQPHHTDYSGGVWHGTYLTWMEAARVECLRSLGVDFEELVALGCDLPVVEISIRYHRQLQMGAQALVRARMPEVSGVRIPWEYQNELPRPKRPEVSVASSPQVAAYFRTR